jgi:hypothetical protein
MSNSYEALYAYYLTLIGTSRPLLGTIDMPSRPIKIVHCRHLSKKRLFIGRIAAINRNISTRTHMCKTEKERACGGLCVYYYRNSSTPKARLLKQ